MTHHNTDAFDKHSLHYKKWLVKIKYNDYRKPVYLVWVTDTLDNENDKILTDANGQLIGSSYVDSLVNHILGTKHKLFDSRMTRLWAKKIKGIKPKASVTYDFDKILSIKKTIDNDGLEEIANFINLFTDLITTTNEKRLERLRRRKEIKEVWGYYYSNIFWPKFNDPKKFKTFEVKGYQSTLKLQSTLKKMTNQFVQRIAIVK